MSITGTVDAPGTVPAWSVEQVLALAPDAGSQRAARGLAIARPWSATGYDPAGPSLWGLCAGSGANPYQTCVDLAEPAYKCSCPSRKFPCKHALALLLLWTAGAVATADPPDYVTQWRAGRAERGTRAATRVATPPSAKAVAQREGRVEAGLDELDRWLTDLVRQGLASTDALGYAGVDRMSARLVDAQAPGLAGAVRRLAGHAATPDRLLAELALLRLAVHGFRRRELVDDGLAATVRTRVGFPVAVVDVLATPPVRDVWLVTAVHDEVDDKLTSRWAWLRGQATARAALVLSHAAPGQSLPADLPLGTALDADLCFYPGGQPLRAVVATRHGPARSLPAAPAGDSVAVALDGYATALAGDPWLDRWPMLLAGVVPAARPAPGGTPARTWYLIDAAGAALPVDPGVPEPWRLLAVSGGEPVTVSATWGPAGLRPRAVWSDGILVAL